VFLSGTAWPGNSSIDRSGSNQNLADSVVSAVDKQGHVKARGGVNPTQFIIDVTGYLR
jgi:hypothetical protein